MWTIIEKNTGKVLFATVFPFESTKTEVAIEHIYSGEIPENSELYFNFETEKFYLHENT